MFFVIARNNRLEECPIVRTVENIPDFARCVFMPCSIVHFLHIFGVRIQSNEARRKGEVIVVFPWFPVGSVSIFPTLRTFSMMLVVSSEADTAVYTAAVTNRFEPREELDALFCFFETILLLVRERSFKPTKCSFCKVIFNL